MIDVDTLSDDVVRSVVTAINTGNRAAFLAILTPDATLSDDGIDRDLTDWVDREIFSSNGHMDVLSESDGGLSLVALYRNDTWGEMRTRWQFTVASGRVSRIETGQT